MMCLTHLRYVQAFLSLPILIAAIIFIATDHKTKNSHYKTPCEGQFLIFLAPFTWLVLSYFLFAPARFQKMWAVFFLEALTWFFWVGDFIAIAATVPMYKHRKNRKALKATTIMAGVQALLWCVSLGVVIFEGVRKRKAEKRQRHTENLAGETVKKEETV
ncbi:hypothetical protein K440DRAFT_664827 [Wilcoxina mikolae CBS 423.85]|nr:hypothetical protein K440DRAFT_664827 [Wilcoxina mikolae CBS 423.85]